MLPVAHHRISSLGQTFVSTSNNVTFSFIYNPANQALTRTVTNDAYTVDPSTTSVSYSPNALNQYASINSSSNTYDARGDLTLEGTSSNAWTYDLQNELLTANLPTAVTLTYDATGRLQSSTASSMTATFLYAGQMLVGEYNGSTIVGRYIPGPDPDEALLWYSGTGTTTPQWLAADQAGSTIAWSNASGDSGATYAYDPFGQPGGTWGGPRYRYTGQIEIPEAHLYDYKARAYFPQQGRFLQTDRIGTTGGVNLYVYAGNDPINFLDPTGQDQLSDYLSKLIAVDPDVNNLDSAINADLTSDANILSTVGVYPGTIFSISTPNVGYDVNQSIASTSLGTVTGQIVNPSLPNGFTVAGWQPGNPHSTYAYQLTANGVPWTGSGYFQEDVSPDEGINGNNQDFIPFSGGLIYDSVGLAAQPQSGQYYDQIFTQTYYLQVQGAFVIVPPVLVHEVFSVGGVVVTSVKVKL